MQRRQLLGSAGALVTAMGAGCLEAPGNPVTQTGNPDDGSTDDERRYKECGREIITYDMFPSDVQSEIDAALDGSYEDERVYLRDTMDTTASYVAVDGEYYDPSIDTDGDLETLELEHVKPRALPRERSISVTNERDEPATVTLELLASDDGSVLLEEMNEVEGDSVRFGGVARTGSHDLHVTVDEDEEYTDSVTITESKLSIEILIMDDDVAVGGSVADLVECNFEG